VRILRLLPPPPAIQLTWSKPWGQPFCCGADRVLRRTSRPPRSYNTPARSCARRALREDLGAYAGGLPARSGFFPTPMPGPNFLPEAPQLRFLSASKCQCGPRRTASATRFVGLIAEGVADLGIVASTVDASRTARPFRFARTVSYWS